MVGSESEQTLRDNEKKALTDHIAHLVIENNALKDELRKLRRQSCEDGSTRRPGSNGEAQPELLTPKSFEAQPEKTQQQYEELRSRYSQLRKDYADIYHNHDVYKKAYGTVKSKYKECKAALQKIKEIYDRKILSEERSRPKTSSNNGALPTLISEEGTDRDQSQETRGSLSTDEGVYTRPNHETRSRSAGGNSSEKPTSAAQDEEDEVMVVFERPVKRKRSPPRRTPRDNSVLTTTPQKRVRVKLEPLCSPTAILATPILQACKESLDLDEVGQQSITPKKRVKLINYHKGLTASPRRFWLEEQRNDRALSEPADVKRESQSTGVLHDLYVAREEDTEKMEGDCSVSPVQIKAEKGIGALSQDLTQEASSRAVSRLSEDSAAGRPLRALSPNIHAGASSRTDETNRAGYPGSNINDAEDHPKSQNSVDSPSSRTMRIKTESEKRLGRLLSGENPVKTPLKTVPHPRSNSKSSVKIKREPNIEEAPVTPRNPPAPNCHLSATRPFSVSTPAPTSLRKEALSRLCLSDFKPNPARNLGHSRHFVAPVRGNAKQCLSGCTNPACCGTALRAAVAAGGLSLPPLTTTTLSPATRVHASSSVDQQNTEDNDDGADDDEEDERLLRWHLGSAYDPAGLAPAERERLLLDARTRRAADRYGKHRRLVGERQRTPPGFWRTEMPSTQEEERDRQEARRREREEVERRWGEAVREGGEWIFRDEG